MSYILCFVRYLISYFKEVVLEVSSSSIHDNIEITVVNGRKVLNSGEANYSYGTLKDAFYQLFKEINISNHQVQNVLILGFGGGSVAKVLRKEYYPEAKITGFEIDDEVLRLGRKYFKSSSIKNCRLIHHDAYLFDRFCGNQKFDLIIFDVYIGLNVPEKFEQDDFLITLKAFLNEKGTLIYNRLIHDQKSEESFIHLKEKMEVIYPGIRVLTLDNIKQNMMFVYQ
ncbi:MAG: methyltransferase domain-containing protein [Bacteroidales bacterium]|nr:methyltransferase domain-containing protein [Bacteroidales bacterium]